MSLRYNSVSGFVAGTYSFHLLVTNSFGLTAKGYSRDKCCWPSNIDIATSNNSDERHILGNDNGLDQSTHATELVASAWTINGVTVYYRGVLNLILARSRLIATIVSAKLSLYSNPLPLNGDLGSR
jgi:hypothetical protein